MDTSTAASSPPIEGLRGVMPHLDWKQNYRYPHHEQVYEAALIPHRALCLWLVWKPIDIDSRWKAVFNYNGAQIQVTEGETPTEAINRLRRRILQAVKDLQVSAAPDTVKMTHIEPSVIDFVQAHIKPCGLYTTDPWFSIEIGKGRDKIVRHIQQSPNGWFLRGRPEPVFGPTPIDACWLDDEMKALIQSAMEADTNG